MTFKQDYKSICRACHGGCSALLSVKEKKLVRVRPDPDTGFNQGRMCSKGLSAIEMMYHPDRLLTPLKRKGKRGDKTWEALSWDEALDEIAGKIQAIKSESGPEAIAVGQGTGRHHFMHVIRFANTLGTPNWYEPGLANCFIPRITVCNLTYGGFVSADYYGNVNPKTILFWGHNPLVTGADGELSFLVDRALKHGSFGMAVDPRRSETAKKCGLWLPIRPGTDAALALSMIHVIIQEDLIDKAFVEQWTSGFQRLKTHVKDFTPGWASEITRIPEPLILEAARRYALDKPSVLEWGVSIEHTPNSLQTVRAIALLRGITGNIGAPGSDIFGSQQLKPYPVLRNFLSKEAAAKRLGASEFKLLGGFRAVMPSAHIPAVMNAMRYGDPYRIRALLNFGSNPLTTIANSTHVEQALKSLDLLVVADLFMTPTASLADYVLPAALWPEVDQIVEIPYIAGHAVMAQQKTVTTGQCLPDEEILNRLASKLGLPGSDESLQTILDQRLEDLNMSFDELKRAGMVFQPPRYYEYQEKGFRTPTRKIELYSTALKRMGYDPLPVYSEPPESPISSPAAARDFPYVLTTGSRRRPFFHSEHRQIASLRKKHPYPMAEINPKDAAKHRIATGRLVQISTPRGSIKMTANVTDDIMPGVVNIDHGWWFPEKADTGFGIFEANANLLTSDQPPYDPAFGSYQLRGLLCSIKGV